MYLLFRANDSLYLNFYTTQMFRLRTEMYDIIVEMHRYLDKNECERSQLVCRHWNHWLPVHLIQRRTFDVTLKIDTSLTDTAPVYLSNL